MIAYKLVRLKKNNSIGSLFINRSADLPLNEWLEAKEITTKGFSSRRGWHCTFKMSAPHLKLNLSNGEKRIWVQVEIKNYTEYKRPETQGGTWLLAEKMKILKIIY